jgi:RNA polymerase sigma factor (sigma-70 family)
MGDSSSARSGAFEERVLVHLDAAYNLARWLLRDERAAEDAVQEACLRAYRHFGSLRGDDARPWLLGIVRNTCFTLLERRRGGREEGGYDDAGFDALPGAAVHADDPAAAAERRSRKQQVDAALGALTPLLREVIVLRELEDLAYADIARIIGVPIGTVMSRLARARERLRALLLQAGVDERGGD